jgi:osmotically-inducible protein OsmY
VTYSTSEPRIRYEPLPTYYYETAPAAAYDREAMVVTAPRRTEDQAITAEVIDNIAYDPRITNGNIGVETRRGTVELSGLVTTPGQADAARRDAQAVPGVVDVQSTIRSKVGASR